MKLKSNIYHCISSRTWPPLSWDNNNKRNCSEMNDGLRCDLEEYQSPHLYLELINLFPCRDWLNPIFYFCVDNRLDYPEHLSLLILLCVCLFYLKSLDPGPGSCGTKECRVQHVCLFSGTRKEDDQILDNFDLSPRDKDMASTNIHNIHK